MVEFAITLPVLLLLVLGTIDLGMTFKTYIALTNAAREGARSISINPSAGQNGAHMRVRQEVPGHIDGPVPEDVALAEGGYWVTFSSDAAYGSADGPYAAGDHITVEVHYPYELLFGSITRIPDIEITASSTMVVLYDE